MTAPNTGDFFRLQLRVEGVLVVDRLLRGIEEHARDLTPAWPQVVMAFRAIEKKAFETEGGSTDDGPWPELAPKTQRERARLGYGAAHPILQRTQKLHRALTLGVGVYERMTRDSLALQLEPDLKYFDYHQSRAPRKRLPRRAMVSLTEQDRQELMRPIRLHITGRDPNAPRRSAIP